MTGKKIILFVISAFILISCSKDFLEGPEVMEDPNRATNVTADQLFNGVQVKTFFILEGQLNRIASLWMQQLGGTSRQMNELSKYNYVENDTNDEMDDLFTDGGLVDIKEIRRRTEEAGNRVYSGIIKFYESILIGTAASLWGDFPYFEACMDVTTPRFDSQADIYAALHDLLDEAIADLQSGERGTTLSNSPANDVVFGGNVDQWIKACYSLKARLYMHLAEVDAANYTLALAAAQNGMASYNDNFASVHTNNLNEEMAYHTFFNQRDSYIRGGKHIIDMLAARSDPRLSFYFDPDADGNFVGAAPGEDNDAVSNLSMDEYLAADKSLDLLSWEETQLIIAECAFKNGDEGTAVSVLNSVRRGIEDRYMFDANSLGDASGLSGEDLFAEIMTEKYLALFLNVEVYNDWKRTNYPVLVPFGGGDPATRIPRRLFYSADERNANPNIPTASAQPLRNANDPY
jgi:hypothetical protein